MERVHVDEIEQAALSGSSDRRPLSNAVGATDVVVMYYELEPGDVLSGSYHTHLDQEEAFVVLEGEVTFDTEAGEAAVTIGQDEAIRFAPGEYQHGYNASEAPARVLAIGAPPGMDETVAVFTCPACDQEGKHDVELDEDRGLTVTTCRACDNDIRTDLGD